MVRGTQYQQLRQRAEELVSKKSAGSNPTLIRQLVKEIPAATEEQAERALNKARRTMIGEKRNRSGSRPTFCAVAAPDELAMLSAYADRHGVRKATAFHDGLALLMWLDEKGLAEKILPAVRQGKDPRHVFHFSS